jgi:hypothetical protein
MGGILFETNSESLFLGSEIKLNIKGYDSNYNPTDVDIDDIDFDISGVEGKIEDGIFIPSSSGIATISATYQSKKDTVTLRVLEEPVLLEIDPKNIILDKNSSQEITCYGIDNEGYRAQIPINAVTFDVPDTIGTFNDHAFVSNDQAYSGIITASYGNLSQESALSIGFKEETIEGFESINAEFLSYPDSVTGRYNLSNKEKEGQTSGKLSYDFTTTDATRAAYIEFNNPIQLETAPLKLGLWVYGSKGGGHWLRGRISDADGNIYTIDFARSVNWTGWDYVEASIPTNIKTPINIERLYLVETDPALQDEGYIYVDQLTACYAKEIP